ncbi:NAC domain-containing protein 83 [Diospyros lotus]|uniref:NAC domain-containing protein 83 n=1 Tax=Diospyros lotus TaxID=55363 RepID=UPI00225A8ECB|nr:NAC domain-containing protein 83 [Diospyros lotus]
MEMEKQPLLNLLVEDNYNNNNNNNGGGGTMKLPVGFRFHPTDEELVMHYLKPKVLSLPLPAQVIPDLDVFHTYPWDLPGDPREKRYFFCKRRRNNYYGNGWNGIINGGGYWKVKGKEKYVLGGGSKQAVGVKKSLVFRHCFCGRQSTNYYWVMQEYRLLASSQTTLPLSAALNLRKLMQLGVGMEEDWVVCCIFQKKKKPKKGRRITPSPSTIVDTEMEVVVVVVDFHQNSGIGGPPPQAAASSSSSSSSSSRASEITEVSAKAITDQEEISPYLQY